MKLRGETKKSGATHLDNTYKQLLGIKQYARGVDDKLIWPLNYRRKRSPAVGRAYGESNKPCLQRIIREVRGYLCSDIYWDIDIVNAHWYLALNYTKKNSLQYKYINIYVACRSQIYLSLEQTGVSKNATKTLFIALINGGTSTKGIKKEVLFGNGSMTIGELIAGLANEVNDIYVHIQKTNPWLVSSTKVAFNKKTQTLAIFWQTLEFEIMSIIIGLCIEREIKYC